MRTLFLLSLFAILTFSCTKSETPAAPVAKTTGHLYCAIDWQSSLSPQYISVRLYTEAGALLQTLNTSDTHAKLDFGELNPGNYYLDGDGSTPGVFQRKATQQTVQMQANVNKTATLVFD